MVAVSIKARPSMLIEPEISTATVVLRGSFNPTIFQPYWFENWAVIPPGVADSADISLITPDVTAFTIDSLFTLLVDRDRFSLESSVAPLIKVADTAIKIFGELLPHTPIHMLGINRGVHFNMSPDQRERLGRLLAPREPWGEFGERLGLGHGPRKSGLQSLVQIRTDVGDRAGGGYILAKIESSKRIGQGTTGVYMEVNDHYEIQQSTGASTIMTILSNRFDDSIRYANSIIEQIMGL